MKIKRKYERPKSEFLDLEINIPQLVTESWNQGGSGEVDKEDVLSRQGDFTDFEDSDYDY